jgi:hypothetical protein
MRLAGAHYNLNEPKHTKIKIIGASYTNKA